MRFAIFCLIVALYPLREVEAQALSTNGPVRPMSLAECIRSALERNLSIQVGDRIALGDTADLDVRSGGRLGIEEARLDLYGSYGYYDPTLFFRAGQSFNSSTPNLNDLTVAPGPSREAWRESFNATLSGVLPTGTRYDLVANGTRLSGTDFGGTNGPSNIPWEYSGDAFVRVTQPLLRDFWIDRQRLNIKLFKKGVSMSEWSFELLVMDIINRVATAYFDLLAARDQIRVQTTALGLAQQLVDENRKKVAVGTLAPLDEKQAEAQAAKAKSDLTTSIFVMQQAENILKSLITHDFSEIQPATIEPTDKLLALYQAFSLPESWRTGLERRPDFLLAKQQVENRGLVLQYRRNQLFPALDLEGTYGRNALGVSSDAAVDSVSDNRYPKYGGFAVLNFPLTFRTDRAEFKRAKLQQQAAILTLKRKEDSVLQEIDIALRAVQSAYAVTESTREQRAFAEAALQAEQKKLENGKSTSFNVLQFQRDLTAASSAEIKALADYNKSLHTLYFREGTILERNKVTLEVK